MSILESVILFIAVMMGFTIAGIVGFGGNLLTLPILSFLFPVKNIVLAFAAISLANSTMRTILYRKSLLWKPLLRNLAVMLCGSIVGLTAYHSLPENYLKLILALFVIVMAVYNLTHRKSAVLPEGGKDASRGAAVFYTVILFLGGVFQGAFVCGGPLLVIFCSHYYGYDRQRFLGMEWALVWVNAIVVMASNLAADSYHGVVLQMSIIGVLSLVGAFWLSKRIAGKIPDQKLGVFINAVLILSGVSTLLQTLPKLL